MWRKTLLFLILCIVMSSSVLGYRSALTGQGIDLYSAERDKIAYLDQENNFTENNSFQYLQAIDYLYPNGTSCCGAGGPGTDYTYLSNFTDDLGHIEDNTSWNRSFADTLYSNDTDTTNTTRADLMWVNISAYLLDTNTQLSGADVVSYVGNWSADKSDYYTSAEVLALNSSWNYTVDTTNTTRADLMWVNVSAYLAGEADTTNTTRADLMWANVSQYLTDTNTDTQDISYDAPTDVISLVDGGSIDISEVDTDTQNTTRADLMWANVSAYLALNASFGTIRGFSASTYSGNMSNATHIGYERPHQICADEYAGSHMCSCVEMMRAIANDDYDYGTNQTWCTNGAPGYIAAANDCEGYTKETSEIASFWDYGENNGAGSGKLTVCVSALKLSCCGGI